MTQAARTRCRPASLAAGLALAVTLTAGCFEAPRPECAFLCGQNDTCPEGYTCRGDGWCKREGVADDLDCGQVAVDAGDAAVLVAAVDAAPVDAGQNDAGQDDAGLDDAGLDDAGPDDAGLDDAGLDDAGPDDAGPPSDAQPAPDALPEDDATARTGSPAGRRARRS